MLRNPSRSAVVTAANQRRRSIFHHGDQLRGSLPGVERHHDQPFGHDRQIHRHPADAVGRQQPHAVAFFSPLEARNERALRTISSNSPPVTPVTSPRESRRIRVSAAAFSCTKMLPTNGMMISNAGALNHGSRKIPGLDLASFRGSIRVPDSAIRRHQSRKPRLMGGR